MAQITLTRTRIASGRWEGILTAEAGAPPALSATLDGAPVDGLAVTADDKPGNWRVSVPIAAGSIADGIQVYLIADAASGEKLAAFSIAAGDVLQDDLRAEVELLRAELDMLKRAFRRHCVETAE